MNKWDDAGGPVRSTGYLWNIENDTIVWDKSAAAVLKMGMRDLPSGSLELYNHINPQDLPQRLSIIHSKLQDRGAVNSSFNLTFRMRCGDGTHLHVREKAWIHTNNKGQTLMRGKLEFSDRVSQRSLPGLDNPSLMAFESSVHSGRRRIMNNIRLWLDRTSEFHPEGYVLAVGIDRLSFFNETFGIEYADMLIEETGLRLRGIFGPQACISRIDGDVFAVFLEEKAAGKMKETAENVLRSFVEEPVETAYGPVCLGVSIGGALCYEGRNREEGGEVCDSDPGDTLTQAELALGMAKTKGRGCFVSYRETRKERARYQSYLQMADRFLRALKSGRVRLAYQPVMDTRAKRVSFHECLIRIIDEDGRVINAADFMPALEELGLCRIADRRILELAVAELMTFPDLHLSVNISTWTLGDDTWLRVFTGNLQGKPEIASRLIIEVTESAVMQDMEHAEHFIRTVKAMGCRVALDDFGAGHTAFMQLQVLEFDIVKIDRSFIRKMNEGKNYVFVKVLQQLAKTIDMETVGEGAETGDEADILARDGIDHVQGYVYGMPSLERIWLPEGHAGRALEEQSLKTLSPLNAHTTVQGRA